MRSTDFFQSSLHKQCVVNLLIAALGEVEFGVPREAYKVLPLLMLCIILSFFGAPPLARWIVRRLRV